MWWACAFDWLCCDQRPEGHEPEPEIVVAIEKSAVQPSSLDAFPECASLIAQSLPVQDAAHLRAACSRTTVHAFDQLLRLEQAPQLARQHARFKRTCNEANFKSADELLQNQRWLWKKRRAHNWLGAPYGYIETGSVLDGWADFFRC
eukprot:s219_g44.t1